MATALKLKLDIKKLKAAINSKATPKSFLPKLKSQLEKSEKELDEVKKTGKPPKKTTTSGNEQTLTALQKLIQKKKYRAYQGQGVDLEKDAKEGAFATGRRVSKGLKANQYGDKKDNKGNVYYEYRPNRLDVKQPKKAQKYPKLEKGGLMGKIKAIKSKYSGGGMSDRYSTEVGDEQITITVGGKEKTGYPVYARVSGYAPKTVGVFPTKEAAEKKAMQLEKKNKLEDGGYMAKGGGIYSSEELYIVKVFDGKSGELLDMSKRVWAKNISQAQIMAMEDFEDEMKAKYGDHLRFKVEEAPSMMKKGGYMARGGMLEVGDMVMVDDSGYAKYFSEFDTSKPAKIISKDKAKVFGKVKYLYGLEMADGRKPFNKAMESMLTKVSEQGGYMADGGFVAVSEKDGYWFIISKPTTKEKAQEVIKMGGLPRGEVGKVVTVEQAKAHKKIIGEEYLADGGYMAGGGEVGEGFLIRDMKEKLNKLFPYSFGFTVTNFEKEGDKFKNDAALLADTEKYYGLQDADIKSKLFFPQYKRDHDIRFRIYQGGENTYFYFILESEKGENYIGQFGFKDRGDVSSDYITRFIAFLMEQYGLPFTVEHSVMAKGGYMAHGGELHRMEGGE